MAMPILKTYLKLLLGKGVQKSYAQAGEDLVLRPFLTKERGLYVDVGCYHPMLYSNTYRLYKLGWKGVVIDPNLRSKKLFSIFRPRDRFIHSGVGTAAEKMYFEFSDGAYNTFDAEVAEGYKKKTKLVSSYSLSIRPLSELLAGVERIDLLSVDVEGMDLEVLQSHDWKVMPSVIIIEASPDSLVGEYLREKGYVLVGRTQLNSIFKFQP